MSFLKHAAHKAADNNSCHRKQKTPKDRFESQSDNSGHHDILPQPPAGPRRFWRPISPCLATPASSPEEDFSQGRWRRSRSLAQPVALTTWAATESKMAFNELPRAVTETTIPTAMSIAMRPYSIAVAPDSSVAKS